ncbi:hypothetical protein B566_EDAN007497 [Ephemera danica]|nr:hypothetical protein B566_EDAN007497 [Ephemera danica]
MSNDAEEFGFVARDPALLDRATDEKQEEDFRSPSPPQQEALEVNTPPGVTDNNSSRQGDSTATASPSVSKRGSTVSVGSISKASSVSSQGSSKQQGKSKAANTEVILPQAFQSKDKTTSATVAFHSIDSISYGVQDLVYTRVFSMIVVRESAELKGQHPFECHAFVCDSRAHARKLTYALAAAFHEYSRSVRASSATGSLEGVGKRSKKFAIDLRTPEQIEKDLQTPQEADSEA